MSNQSFGVPSNTTAGTFSPSASLHGLSPGAEVGITILAIVLLLLSIWLFVKAYKLGAQHFAKSNPPSKFNDPDTLELGQRTQSTDLNAAHGLQDLRILKEDVSTCVCQ